MELHLIHDTTRALPFIGCEKPYDTYEQVQTALDHYVSKIKAVIDCSEWITFVEQIGSDTVITKRPINVINAQEQPVATIRVISVFEQTAELIDMYNEQLQYQLNLYKSIFDKQEQLAELISQTMDRY